ncbi:glucosyltransferase domain-containing protein [Candidatus Pelagibacter sp.]|nr:glucosyltransferase domain-containing protein [Candidatus Pelagibacter sp.]
MEKKLNLFFNEKFFYLTIFISLFVAYYPSLIFDFATQDQWRFSRYDGIYDKNNILWQCVDTNVRFFLATGRPFTFITECLEHVLVADIKDLKYLRLFNFLSLYLTFVLIYHYLNQSKFYSFIVIFALALSPGFVFMFIQGLTAFGVIFSLFLSIAANILFENYFEETRSQRKKLSIIFAYILMVCSLLCYPIFALLNVILFFFKKYLFFHEIKFFFKKNYEYLIFIFFSCLAYLIIVKLINYFLISESVKEHLSGSHREFGLSNIIILIKNTYNFNFKNFFLWNYLSNIKIFEGGYFFIFLIFLITHYIYKKDFTLTLIIFLAVLFFVNLSSAPLLLSHGKELANWPTRYFVGFDVMCLILFLYFFIMLYKLNKNIKLVFYIPHLIILGLIFNQVLVLKQSVLLGNKENLLFENQIIKKISYPKSFNVIFNIDFNVTSEKKIHVNSFKSGEYAAAITQNPEHRKQILRYLLNKNKFFGYTIVDCRYQNLKKYNDYVCDKSVPENYYIKLFHTKKLNSENLKNKVMQKHKKIISDANDYFLVNITRDLFKNEQD